MDSPHALVIVFVDYCPGRYLLEWILFGWLDRDSIHLQIIFEAYDETKVYWNIFVVLLDDRHTWFFV